MKQDRDLIAAFLEGKVASGASSQDVGEVIAAAFQGIDRALVPVMGQRGVAALYQRALHLARTAWPWLPAAPDGVPATMDIAALTNRVALRTAADAALGGAALLQTFHALLISLIGESLTERLLRPVWATFLSGSSARDITP